MREITLKELLEAGCHFGHKVTKWNPKAKEYIYRAVGDTHIIDLAQTKLAMEKAADFIIKTVESGGEVVFIGTKRQAVLLVKQESERVGAPYMNKRWIGGFITNWGEVKKNIGRLNELNQQLADENALTEYTKRERLLFERDMNKLKGVYGGVAHLESMPKAIVVMDARKDAIAVREAKQRDITVIGVVDTNADPDPVDYLIPSNDDAVGAINCILSYLADAYSEGKIRRQKKIESDKKAAEKVADLEEKKRLAAEKKEQKSKVTKEQK